VLVDALNAALRDHPAVARTLAVVSYGHELEPSALLSKAADVRVIWGGDATIETIRALPLAPHATELLFGDRFSLAVVDADSPEDDLPRRLYNDAYWFDQMGCSSPRLVVGVGAGAQDRLERLFDGLQHEIAERRYALELGAVLAKRAYAYGALADRPIARFRELGNELTVLELTTLDGFDRTHPARRPRPARRAQGPDDDGERDRRRAPGPVRAQGQRPRHRPDRPVRRGADLRALLGRLRPPRRADS
jgi:hypothetical protein